MKAYWPLMILLLVGATAVWAAAVGREPGSTNPHEHRIVFELTQAGEEAWAGALTNVENLHKAFGQGRAKIEVVVHSKGLGMLLAANASQQQRMKALADAGVVFAACQNTMRREKVTEKDLMPFATTVDSGVAEVVRKQEVGWSYLKAG